jgi:penicillin V acylase-like amidase (Ntn superfamily)
MNEATPIKVMTNLPYAHELETLKQYQGFGGQA